ncbi:MAG: YbjN domain-containing protein [Polyangiaceae bacterium]
MDPNFEKAKELVEATIRKIGLDPHVTRAACPNDNQAAWTLKRGSASVLVTVTHQENEDVTYLRVASPVVKLPADSGNQVALFRRLLELNAGGLANAGFGLLADRVVVVSERPAADLDDAEVEQIVRHTAAVADTFDDRFEKEFGAPKA